MYSLEWNVKNAVNRDVERQHLNKILADIKSTVQEVYDSANAIQAGIGDPYAAIAYVVSGSIQRGLSVVYDPTKRKLNFTANSFTITLQGDVTGSAQVTNLSSVIIDTTLNAEGIVREAPINQYMYWRGQGQWQQVPTQVQSLANIIGPGYMTLDAAGNWRASTLQTASTDRITILNGNSIDEDGNQADAIFDLAEVTPTAGGTLQLLAFDAYGRRIQEDDATTDDLPEGTTNLYFTEERVYEAVKDQLVAGSNITLDADDVAQTITISATGGFVPYFIPDNTVFLVPLYQQALFTLPIDLGDGASIELDGALVEVN